MAALVLRSSRWWLVPLGLAVIALTARLGEAQAWWALPGGLNHPLAQWNQSAAGILAARFAESQGGFQKSRHVDFR
jgi:hypothetical protein